MKYLVKKSDLEGSIKIPGSKSNTTRAVFIASLAEGKSIIRNPLPSADCLSTVKICKNLGAEIDLGENWTVKGVGKRPKCPSMVLDSGNSGTTFYIALAVAGLIEGYSVIAGDPQLSERPAQSLIDSLNDLGAKAFSTRNTGTAPIIVKGILKGGKTKLPGINSQWLTPLLINCPLSDGDTEVYVENLQEKPYIRMTLGWLKRQNISFKEENMEKFYLPGGQSYKSFDETIPGDWESACFPLVAAAITNSEITVYGLDINNYQGDKAIINILRDMGANIEVKDEGRNGIIVKGGKDLRGIEINCSDLPDIIPIAAVLGCRAKGKTVLTNLGASRLKETDRVRSITEELIKMGAKIEESENSLTVYESDLRGTLIDGRNDHRIVMATAVAGFIAKGSTLINNAEYVKISFPNFFEIMSQLGANIERLENV